ncbi:hypothetical protein JRO89_XS06G0008400 [Xanthoceras sorbifolium]|uniref:Uncharacterized protein n=1 Tax=Xanthoceras sorbifolium TaxID=99658 RepID=A0ABQ8HVV6_9ROSI|nr:hypothetical protein JRO89_XS06G0008400 [Xanthoceras sorbifolium]
MGGGMEANKNKFIEEWGSVRENLEQNFRWTRRNLALVGLFGIAIPIFVYRGIVKEFGILGAVKHGLEFTLAREL